jgi:hypothetical protein
MKKLYRQFLHFSSNAARKSGTRGEIREGVFSDGITGCLGRLAAQTSGVKNILYRQYFSLFLWRMVFPVLPGQKIC